MQPVSKKAKIDSTVVDAKALISDLIREKNCGPILIRLAWHDAGTYDHSKGSGGPRACMRFAQGESTHGANAGLDIARGLLAPIVEKFADISTADMWSLAAIVAVKEMGGPSVAWRPGRTDSKEAKDSVEDGRLPDAQQGCPHLRSVFHRMQFSDQEIVALSGAHTIGGMKLDRSGHQGDWTARSRNFDNSYFQDLLNLKWEKFTNEKGNVQFKSDRNTFMLPSDVALLDDKKMKVWVQLYAQDEARFFQDFASAFTKLQELGVKAFQEC